MDKEHSNRIQTSLLNGVERKALIWLAERQPSWVTSDMLTAVGSLGALMIAAGFILANININFIWLATAGLVVNWYGDSLDGSLARVRHAQRPTYGFFVDHMVDCFNETAMFIGVGLSPLMHLSLALLVLAFYFQLSIYVFISAHLKGEFRLTYAKMGPTEFRILGIIVNTIVIYVTPLRDLSVDMTFFGAQYAVTLFDIVAMFLVVVLAVMLLVSFLHDAHEYAKMEPLKRNVEK